MCGAYQAVFYTALAALAMGTVTTVGMYAMALLGRPLHFYPFLLLIVGSGGLIGATLGLSMNTCLTLPIPLRWLGL